MLSIDYWFGGVSNLLYMSTSPSHVLLLCLTVFEEKNILKKKEKRKKKGIIGSISFIDFGLLYLLQPFDTLATLNSWSRKQNCHKFKDRLDTSKKLFKKKKKKPFIRNKILSF